MELDQEKENGNQTKHDDIHVDFGDEEIPTEDLGDEESLGDKILNPTEVNPPTEVTQKDLLKLAQRILLCCLGLILVILTIIVTTLDKSEIIETSGSILRLVEYVIIFILGFYFAKEAKK